MDRRLIEGFEQFIANQAPNDLKDGLSKVVLDASDDGVGSGQLLRAFLKDHQLAPFCGPEVALSADYFPLRYVGEIGRILGVVAKIGRLDQAEGTINTITKSMRERFLAILSHLSSRDFAKILRGKKLNPESRL